MLNSNVSNTLTKESAVPVARVHRLMSSIPKAILTQLFIIIWSNFTVVKEGLNLNILTERSISYRSVSDVSWYSNNIFRTHS